MLTVYNLVELQLLYFTILKIDLLFSLFCSYILSIFIPHVFFFKLPLAYTLMTILNTGHLLDIYQHTLNFKKQVTLMPPAITFSILAQVCSYTQLEHVQVLNKMHIYHIQPDHHTTNYIYLILTLITYITSVSQ